MKLCCPLRSVCLLDLFSHENKEGFFFLFSVFVHMKSINEDLPILIEMSVPKLNSAPLTDGSHELAILKRSKLTP